MATYEFPSEAYEQLVPDEDMAQFCFAVGAIDRSPQGLRDWAMNYLSDVEDVGQRSPLTRRMVALAVTGRAIAETDLEGLMQRDIDSEDFVDLVINNAEFVHALIDI